MSQNTPHGPSYDNVVIGASIAGSASAHVLSAAASTSRTAPLRIALFERSPEPDRIIDELLQPGGVAALRSLGLGTSLDSIDVVLDAGETVHTPYPSRAQGRSFHHGRFIQKLRTRAKAAPGVDVIEATATDLIEPHPCARREDTGQKESFCTNLVVIADGCFSTFRGAVMVGTAFSKRSLVRCNFV